ncbi:hypothetical protein MN116_006489 [Schistosoma mekongi]|uniref:Serpin domain-containing protein n=1 Tax=Schistosoma mekongi TaxID=38744 RepID=A0AAE1ZBH1_SCHME|nr:hypothetical protein MN116_006489 [Schistosoma mekongi]
MCFKLAPKVQDPYANNPSHKAFTRAFLSQSTADFGQDNFLASPLGVLFTLGILLGSGGAQGKTGYQIAKTMRLKSANFPWNISETQQEMKSLYKELSDSLTLENTTLDGNEVKVVRISTGVFTQKTYDVESNFNKSIKNDFGGELLTVDFTNRTNAAHDINKWVNEHSNGLVEEFFTDDIPQDAWLILINIFNFRDYWESPFVPYYTSSENFSVTNNHHLQVPMMFKDEILKYKKFQEDGFEIVSKPMKNTRFSFIILLPLEKWNLNGAIEVLNGNKILSHYVDKLEETSVSLKMPKFTLTKKLHLVGTLKSIGIRNLFDPSKADLSGISSKNNLYVKSFIQTNILKVNESGIEAASVTSPIIVPISALIPEVNFYVTHPFICFIYDQQLTMPLLAAKVINPML